MLCGLSGIARFDSQCQPKGAVRNNSDCCAAYGITTLFSHQFLQQMFSNRCHTMSIHLASGDETYPSHVTSHISHVSSTAQLTPIPHHHSYIASTINTEVGGMCVHCRFGGLTYEVNGNTGLSETVVSPLYYSSCCVIINKVINYMFFLVIICCSCYSIIFYFRSCVCVCVCVRRGGIV